MGYLVIPFSRSVLELMIERSPSYFFLLIGYFATSILMEPRYDIADQVAREDFYALMGGIKARFGQLRRFISMAAGVFTIVSH